MTLGFIRPKSDAHGFLYLLESITEVLLIGEAFIDFSSRRLPALLEQHHLRFIFEKKTRTNTLALSLTGASQTTVRL
jgi:hypothetical protein